MFELPWDAGRAAQSHHPGTGQEKMNRDETRDQKGRRRKLGKTSTKWDAEERTRSLGLPGMYPEIKYTAGISNWLSQGLGPHNFLTEIEKLAQENGIGMFWVFSPP